MSNPKLIFDLSKAVIDRSKLVAKQVQVTRGGKTFTQTVYVNPNQNTPTSNGVKSFDFNEFEKLKADHNKAIQYLKDCGVTWQEHSHAGVNWMRASMAAKQAAGITNGKVGAPAGNTNAAGSHNVKQLDYWKLAADGYDNLDAKKKVASIKKQTDKDEFVTLASKITSWNSHPNPAINLMRASMALSAWCETHSMDDLSIALGSQATGIQSAQVKQPDKPVDPPKPKEELEIQPTHTERQKNMIKIINSISDEKELESYTSAGMVPEDATAKSFIVDRLLTEYNTHIRPAISGTGGYRRGYTSQRELRRQFTKMTTKLYRGVHEKIVTEAVSAITDTEMLYDFVDPRNGVQISKTTKRNYGKNTVMSNMIYELQRDFGGYAEYDDANAQHSQMQTSLQADWNIEESKKKYDSEKDGFVMALKRVGEFDPSLKSQTDEMLETYDSMMQIASYNPKLFNKLCDFHYGSFGEDLEKETVTYYKKKLLIEELRKHGLSDEDIIMTVQRNDYSSYDKAEAWPLYRKKDSTVSSYYNSNAEPILDDNGNEVTIDLTKLYRPDTGEVLWNAGDSVFGWSSGIRAHEIRRAVEEKTDLDKPTDLMVALKSVTPDMYDRFSKLQRKLYGVQLQDSNSQTTVDTEPHTWSYNDMESFRAIKDGDNEELDAVLTNLSFIINSSRINYSIADRMWQSMDSAANKHGDDYSGNFTYHGYDFGTQRTKGNNPQHITAAEKRDILKKQLTDIPLFTKSELTILRDYVNNNGDPTMDSSSYYYSASETLSRIKSLSPEYQGWQGIKGTPIDDIFMRYIESSVQYCPQIYNTRVKDKKDMKKWLYKQTGFTPYQPPQAVANQPTVSGTKLYELRKQLFDKAHCSIRTANPQEYADITHKVKMDFDYVDPKTGKRVPKADRAYDNRTLALHGNVYIINNSEAQDNFQKEAARLNETPIQMYHGTSYGGGCGIVGVDGKFRISGKETSGLQTSGSMLGQGIYMAKLVGKTLPYLGNSKYSYSSYNIANQSGTTQGYRADGCLLVCDAVLGKHYHSDISTSDAARHNDGTYDSVSVGAGAQMGGGTLKEYECIVRRNNQVAPKYIVDCGGRVR